MAAASPAKFTIKEPHGLSSRVQWLRDYFFAGVKRPCNNEFTSWTTGTPWDVVYDETTFISTVPQSPPASSSRIGHWPYSR